MRFALFLAIVLSIWALMHGYVLWRLSSVPWLVDRWRPRVWLLLGFGLWASFPLVRIFESQGGDLLVLPLVFLTSTWIGVLFLTLAGLLAVDLVTLGGWLWSKRAPLLRGYAAVLAALLSMVALVQGIRSPVITRTEVSLPGLPRERDGLRVVMLSDLHLGNLLRQDWLQARVEQVRQLQPDLVCLVGDVIDGDNSRVEPMIPVLSQIQAPLGTWVVSGNHEFYAGLEGSVSIFQQAGFRVLRDQCEELLPGLVLAGMDDLTARSQLALGSNTMESVLGNRPSGATILLSHTPWQAETAARKGVGLMLSGHTHNGQIWPFNYLVQMRYPLIAGRRQVEGMTAIVGRGTGTWGPRMRLWQPAEILVITLKSSGT